MRDKARMISRRNKSPFLSKNLSELCILRFLPEGVRDLLDFFEKAAQVIAVAHRVVHLDRKRHSNVTAPMPRD